MSKRRGGFGGGGGMPGGMQGGMGGMMKQIQKMQEDMVAAQEALANETMEVSVGGGAVKVVISGHQRVQSIAINKEMIDLTDEEWLADLQELVVLGVNQAIEQSQEMAARRMEGITGGLGDNPLLSGLLGS
ncbi:MAG: YbaB/EbfC family nucleoid-associated protein, partial [Anaerolineae bacterium]|nr:YbaB/EbfC family nucleoid-associated protein [Anaerolineae bacterium]MBN8618137.1 YbaB/EbfC family nucleoid-associated protein [Anaerolineae bacterium]